jgi:hypothetical protein
MHRHQFSFLGLVAGASGKRRFAGDNRPIILMVGANRTLALDARTGRDKLAIR